MVWWTGIQPEMMLALTPPLLWMSMLSDMRFCRCFLKRSAKTSIKRETRTDCLTYKCWSLFFYHILFFFDASHFCRRQGQRQRWGWKAVNVQPVKLTASVETSVRGHLIFGLSPELHLLIISLLCSNDSTGSLSNFTQTSKSRPTHSRPSTRFTYAHSRADAKLISVRYQQKKPNPFSCSVYVFYIRCILMY